MGPRIHVTLLWLAVLYLFVVRPQGCQDDIRQFHRIERHVRAWAAAFNSSCSTCPDP